MTKSNTCLFATVLCLILKMFLKKREMDWQLVASYFTVTSTDIFCSVCSEYIEERLRVPNCKCTRTCVCLPILVTTFSEWLSGTEPWRAYPAPCVRPRHVCSVFACTCTFLPGVVGWCDGAG